MRNKLAFLSVATSISLFANPLGNNIDIEKTLHLTNDWQLFGFNEEIDLEKSFGNGGSLVKLVWAWDNNNAGWLAYSPEYSTRKKLEELSADANISPSIQVVDQLAPNQGFWIMSYEPSDVPVYEVYYPLYDTCLNVNSDDFWSDNGLTEIPERCDEYVKNLANFEINDEVATLSGTEISGEFTTNLPIVFMGDLVNQSATSMETIFPSPAYVDANGTVSNVAFTVEEAEYGNHVSFSMTIDEAKESTNYLNIDLVMGYDNNFSNLPKFTIPVVVE
ncbi:hypothetical protein ThvES_00006500 [Thiovulum sp. ES]|nr:hypothetical protein ThvES_00006500 [Thiovulum sp. ES]